MTTLDINCNNKSDDNNQDYKHFTKPFRHVSETEEDAKSLNVELSPTDTNKPIPVRGRPIPRSLTVMQDSNTAKLTASFDISKLALCYMSVHLLPSVKIVRLDDDIRDTSGKYLPRVTAPGIISIFGNIL